jgi:hypothetical protein
MSNMPVNDDAEANHAEDTLKTSLQGDAASWAAARNAPVAEQAAAAFKAPVAKRAAAVKKPKVEAAPPAIVPVVKKPFSMSYDGVTTAQHIQHMIDNGAR